MNADMKTSPPNDTMSTQKETPTDTCLKESPICKHAESNCRAMCEGWTCTRPINHEGPHIACGTRHNLHVWKEAAENLIEPTEGNVRYWTQRIMDVAEDSCGESDFGPVIRELLEKDTNHSALTAANAARVEVERENARLRAVSSDGIDVEGATNAANKIPLIPWVDATVARILKRDLTTEREARLKAERTADDLGSMLDKLRLSHAEECASFIATNNEFIAAKDKAECEGGEMRNAILLIVGTYMTHNSTREQLETAMKEAMKVQRSTECGKGWRSAEEAKELERGCPCQLVEPCSKNCSCANPIMSGGCNRCARYGSLEQRRGMAEHLVTREAKTAELEREVAELKAFRSGTMKVHGENVMELRNAKVETAAERDTALARVKGLEEGISLILPLAKGYTHAHPEAPSNQRMIEAAEQALAGTQGGGWQPIETAPKDETRVLLLSECGVHEGRFWSDGMWVSHRGNGCRFSIHEATHWQPLPLAPTTKPSGGRA